MSIQVQVLEALCAVIDAMGNYAPVSVGPLPADHSLSMAVTTGRSTNATLSGGATVTLDIVLNAKHENQATALDTLCAIHEALTGANTLPGGEGWQVTAVRTGTAPGYLNREGGQWLYGSALSVEYLTD